MISNKQFFFLLGFVFAFVLLFLMTVLSNTSFIIGSYIPAFRNWTNNSNQDYESKCLDLYKKLRFPNASLFFNPALKEPPKEMYDEFIQHGKMPIKRWFYFNDVYSDSKGDQSTLRRVIKKKNMTALLIKVKNKQPQPNYGDKV